MNQSSVVFITGGTGAIGPCVVAAFAQAGYHVRVLARHAPPAGVLPAGVTVYPGDITDAASLAPAMEGVHVVIHLAALLHINTPTPAQIDAYQEINVNGTMNVVAAAARAGVRRLVMGSTIAVYGYGDAQIIDETTIPNPQTPYARTKLDAESIVLQAKQVDGAPMGVVLRLASVYGASMKGNYRRLVHSLARRRFIPIGPGDNRRTLVYEQDVARALLLATAHPKAAGEIFNVSDGQTHTMREIMIAICDALGRKPPSLALPVAPIRMVAGWLEDGGRIIGRTSPVGRATIDKYVEDVQVRSERIQTLLGFTPQDDLTSGWRETISLMRKQGELP